MVVLFVALMFVGCVIVDYFVQPRKSVVQDDVRFEPGLGLCMADGGKPVATPIKKR